MFISDFIAENLSIKFFRTPCMYRGYCSCHTVARDFAYLADDLETVILLWNLWTWNIYTVSVYEIHVYYPSFISPSGLPTLRRRRKRFFFNSGGPEVAR